MCPKGSPALQISRIPPAHREALCASHRGSGGVSPGKNYEMILVRAFLRIEITDYLGGPGVGVPLGDITR